MFVEEKPEFADDRQAPKEFDLLSILGRLSFDFGFRAVALRLGERLPVAVKHGKLDDSFFPICVQCRVNERAKRKASQLPLSKIRKHVYDLQALGFLLNFSFR